MIRRVSNIKTSSFLHPREGIITENCDLWQHEHHWSDHPGVSIMWTSHDVSQVISSLQANMVTGGESWILQIILTALLAGYGVLCPSLPLIWLYCHPIRCSSDYIGEQITQWIPRNKSRFVRLKQVSSCCGEIIWELEKFKLNFISKPSFTQFA